ncbi:hypothetical protein ACLKMY_32860 [Paraburkholderia mimosarum]|uniref:hypothetical protein n=1 Tax=Paraburkholderia mimosarum TaxID=312026 RepID=UPI0039C09B64
MNRLKRKAVRIVDTLSELVIVGLAAFAALVPLPAHAAGALASWTDADKRAAQPVAIVVDARVIVEITPLTCAREATLQAADADTPEARAYTQWIAAHVAQHPGTLAAFSHLRNGVNDNGGCYEPIKGGVRLYSSDGRVRDVIGARYALTGDAARDYAIEQALLVENSPPAPPPAPAPKAASAMDLPLHEEDDRCLMWDSENCYRARMRTTRRLRYDIGGEWQDGSIAGRAAEFTKETCADAAFIQKNYDDLDKNDRRFIMWQGRARGNAVFIERDDGTLEEACYEWAPGGLKLQLEYLDPVFLPAGAGRLSFVTRD